MRLNVALYRLMAYVTGVVLIILCSLAILKPFAPVSGAVKVIGFTHGMLYIVYLLVAFQLARRLRLATWPTVMVLLAGTVPVLTFVVERHVSRAYLAPAAGGAGGTAPAGGAGAGLDGAGGVRTAQPPAR